MGLFLVDKNRLTLLPSDLMNIKIEKIELIINW